MNSFKLPVAEGGSVIAVDVIIIGVVAVAMVASVFVLSR